MATTYREETRYDFKGDPYQVRIPQAISAENIMQPASAADLTPFTDNTNYQAGLNMMQVPQQQQEQKDQIPSYLKAYLEQQPTVPNPANTLQGLNTQYDIQAKAKKVSDLTSQLSAIQTQGQVAQQQLESAAAGKDITSAFLGRQQQEVARQALIQSAPVKMQLDVAQGDLSSAQATVNSLFQAQTQYENNLFNWKNNILEKVYAFAEKQDQAKLDALKVKQQNDFQLKKDAINYAQDLAKTAIENGQGDIASQIMALDTSASDYQDKVSQLAGNIKPKATGDGGLSIAQINATINSIANSFDNEQTVKDYNQATSQYQLMNSLGTGTKNPGDDIAFVYSFAKLMDPNSVVREGEYATVQKYAQSFLDKKTLEAIRLAKNTNFLTEDAKQKLLTTAGAKMKVLQTQYSSLANQYNKRIANVQSGGFNTISDYSAAFPTTNNQEQITPTTDEQADKILNEISGNSSNQTQPKNDNNYWNVIKGFFGLNI